MFTQEVHHENRKQLFTIQPGAAIVDVAIDQSLSPRECGKHGGHFMMDISKAVDALFEKVVEWRRDFHMNPELSNCEVLTSQKVARLLRSFNIDVTENVGGHGVVGLLQGAKKGKTIALRADMDALPVQEQNNFDYKSCVSGVMHACGHDGHTAILLGTAAVLGKMKSELAGNVKFVFQPAEESLSDSGAPRMIRAGVLKNPDVDVIVMLHIIASISSGIVIVGKGPVCAASDKIAITVHGKGGHGSEPNRAIDALLTACQIVDALEMVVGRNVSAFETAVLTIGMLNGGTAANIIADSATMEGTVRTYNPEVQAAIEKAIDRVIEGAAKMSGATAELNYIKLMPAVINNPAVADMVMKACIGALPRDSVRPLAQPLMGSEDFSFYLKAGVPGAMLLLGGGIAGQEVFPNHSPKFNWDENAMKAGMTALISTAHDYLQ
jgi:amidohydrolase